MYIQQYGWDQNKVFAFRQDLLAWYDNNKRDLPWRQNKDPYRIWVSEIMLQQTQVATVIPYFERFMLELPTIQALAQVDEEKLMSLWQGLGYYSRARNLKEAAQQIGREFDGKMPQTMKELLSLKGVGPYTAAAIGSMAFGLVEPAIDGNLLRVTARLFELPHDIAQAKSRKVFETILYELIDPDRPGDFNQAMMDLGATVMTPSNFRPIQSPVKAYDASYINETAHLYPVKSKKIKQTHHEWYALCIIDNQGRVLWRKHDDRQLLSGLWHFPIVLKDDSKTGYQLAKAYLESLSYFDPLILVDPDQEPQVIKHVFSHRVWWVQPLVMRYRGFFDEDHAFDGFTSAKAISKLQDKIMKEIRQSYESIIEIF